jgi:hypothetical protein
MPIKYDKNEIGKSEHVGTYEITEDMIRKYATALRASLPPDPKDWVAPPLFCNVLTGGAGKPEVTIEGGRRRFMANQSYEPIAPIRVGDTLSSTATLTEMYEKTGRSGGMLFIVRETAFTNQDDVTVAKIRHSMVIQE